MTIKKHNDRVDNKNLSLFLSDNPTNEMAVLSYISSPTFNNKNVDIKENELSETSELRVFYPDKDGKLISENNNNEIKTEEVLLTDEYNIKETVNSEQSPLFFKHQVGFKFKGMTDKYDIINNSAPYEIGKPKSTISNMSDESIINNYEDITPLFDIIKIKDKDENYVDIDMKIHLSLSSDNENYKDKIYDMTIYHSSEEELFVEFYDMDNQIQSEILKKEEVYQRVNYEDLSLYTIHDKVYAIKDMGVFNQIFINNESKNVADNLRNPYDFKYRIFGNVKKKLDKDNENSFNIGFFNFSDSNERPSKVMDLLINSSVMPEYISFKNPYPANNYLIDEYGSLHWEISPNLSQDKINEYNLIVISGYGGIHDLSQINAKLRVFVEQGGNIFIDILSNNTGEALNVDFGDIDPIINYSFIDADSDGNYDIKLTQRYKGTEEEFFNRYYSIGDDELGQVAHIVNGQQVGLAINLSDIDLSTWIHIVKYGDDSPCIGYKSIKKGRIYLSNSGIIKGTITSSSEKSSQFLANLLINSFENIWITTPWLRERIYHINQLTDIELNKMNYKKTLSSLTNEVIAKKVMSNNVDELIGEYTNFEYINKDTNYFISALEYTDRWKSASNVHLPNSLKSGEPLSAYVIEKEDKLNLSSITDNENPSVIIDSPTIPFNVTITPYAYKWILSGDDIKTLSREKIYPKNLDKQSFEFEISKSDSTKVLGLLNNLLPPLEDGIQWARNSGEVFDTIIDAGSTDGNKDIYYEIKVGKYDNGQFIELNKPIDLLLYNTASGEYIYDGSGNITISQKTIESKTEKISKNGISSISNKESIQLLAKSNYYELSLNKDEFSLKTDHYSKIELKMSNNLSKHDPWFIKIKELDFIKDRFNKDDYDRIAKTLGFRLDQSYILDTLKNYYDQNTNNNEVLNVISKLNNNNVLDEEDWSIVQNALSSINDSFLYHYQTSDFVKRSSESSIVKKERDERVKFLNDETIILANNNIIVTDESHSRLLLKKIDEETYYSDIKFWDLDNSIVIEAYDELEVDNYREIDKSNYTIDARNGIVKTSLNEELYATFTSNNIQIFKKLFNESSSIMERLTKKYNRFYDIPSIEDEDTILYNPIPILYKAPSEQDLQEAIAIDDLGKYVVDQKRYKIDYVSGHVSLMFNTNDEIFLKYTYINARRLSIKDYDSYSGTVKLNSTIRFNDPIYANYYYNDSFFEYKGYVDNNNFVKLDLNPTIGHYCTMVEYEDGEKTYNKIPSYELLGKKVYLYLKPSKRIKKSRESNEILESTGTDIYELKNKNLVSKDNLSIYAIDESKIESFNKYDINIASDDPIDPSNIEIIDYKDSIIRVSSEAGKILVANYQYYDVETFNESSLRHTFDKERLKLEQLAHPETIVLGSAKIMDNMSEDDIVNIDARKLGGGIKESITNDTIHDIDGMPSGLMDIENFEGYKFKGNGISVIRIPKSVLDKFTEEEVREKINEHLAKGIYPIVEFY